ncbi:rod shape-determining protein RodA [Neisseria arctica]|uniref:Rod shape-determining protein RodA n=1 Tax=Neisseria arctica TaxID=1470200 RepID=A0A0J1C2Q0_9NEIS|nr:MTH938/NDUFAF3 family protein [Neisseria arctica]KLT72543.1 rod shape-determining protein RodA [Neisseria arctica]UOO87596.1 Mth938-like domain-containing protein [Neisseria arctica]
MLIEENRQSGGYNITAHSSGHLEVNGHVYTEAVILTENGVQILENRQPADLTENDFLNHVSTPLPEVVIVGTGEKQLFLHPKINAALAAKGVGLESMSTAAACRTIMILQSEGRRVWAWLWP